jgi:hypothetical protein
MKNVKYTLFSEGAAGWGCQEYCSGVQDISGHGVC